MAYEDTVVSDLKVWGYHDVALAAYVDVKKTRGRLRRIAKRASIPVKTMILEDDEGRFLRVERTN